MTSNRKIPWVRVLAEGAVIVSSILLALALDAWWEGRQDREDEVESLRLIDRDLTTTLERLSGFEDRITAGHESADLVIEALSGPREQLDPEATSRALLRVLRVTVALPSSAYRDLISTGSLRIIRDRDLRDEILQFHEYADRILNIISQNNALFFDQMLIPLLYGEGLLFSTAYAAPFEFRDDPLWRLPPGSPVLDRLRSSLHAVTAGIAIQMNYTDGLRSRASELQEQLRAYLGEDLTPRPAN